MAGSGSGQLGFSSVLSGAAILWSTLQQLIPGQGVVPRLDANVCDGRTQSLDRSRAVNALSLWTRPGLTPRLALGASLPLFAGSSSPLSSSGRLGLEGQPCVWPCGGRGLCLHVRPRAAARPAGTHGRLCPPRAPCSCHGLVPLRLPCSAAALPPSEAVPTPAQAC